jgi:hypothetical protein
MRLQRASRLFRLARIGRLAKLTAMKKTRGCKKKQKKLKSPQKHLSTTVAVYMLLYLFPCMITIAFHSYSINSQS